MSSGEDQLSEDEDDQEEDNEDKDRSIDELEDESADHHPTVADPSA